MLVLFCRAVVGASLIFEFFALCHTFPVWGGDSRFIAKSSFLRVFSNPERTWPSALVTGVKDPLPKTASNPSIS